VNLEGLSIYILGEGMTRIYKRREYHGEAQRGRETREYRIWRYMIQRCYNPKSSNYYLYGGRGITVCQEWRDSYPQFLKDMGRCPPGLSLERKRNNKGYNLGNCVWATATVQQRNKRNSLIITWRRKRQHLKVWAEELGIKYRTLWRRLKIEKLSEEEAFTRPVYMGCHRKS
jgi:hypothetical protein